MAEKFNPAFDMPGTPEQAIAVLREWGKPSVMTFRHERAAQCARLLADAMKTGGVDPVVGPVLAEVKRATERFPTWPTDPLHAVAVLGEEFGELTKAALQTVYEPHKVQPGELRTEAIQTAAMALRFLASLDAYEFSRSAQHQQPVMGRATTGKEPGSVASGGEVQK